MLIVTCTMNVKAILIIGFTISYKINPSQGLDCYKCGYDDQYDVCSDEFRWKEKSCNTVSKLSSGEMLTCIKTSFKYYQNYRQGNQGGRCSRMGQPLPAIKTLLIR